MSCDFTMYWIQVPKDKISQVNDKLVALDLAHCLVINEINGEFFLEETGGDMGYTTATNITDHLFPEMAKILKDTPQDGQVVETECDCEKGYYLLANGESKHLDNFIQEFIPETPILVGTVVEATLKVKIVGLMNGRAGVLEFVFENNQKSQG